MIVSFAPFMNTIRAAKGAMTLLLFVYGVGFSSFLASAQAYTAAIVSQQKTGEPPSTRTGAFADIPDFPSKILGNSRSITVYLPPSYASEKSRRYPVLYAQDGQNLFDRRTAFLGREWELDETLAVVQGIERAAPDPSASGNWMRRWSAVSKTECCQKSSSSAYGIHPPAWKNILPELVATAMCDSWWRNSNQQLIAGSGRATTPETQPYSAALWAG